MKKGLHAVLPGRNGGERDGGEAEDVALECHRVAGLPAVDVDAEDLLAAQGVVADLKARLLRRIVREQQQQTPVERRPGRRAIGHGETHLRGLSRRSQRSQRSQSGEGHEGDRARRDRARRAQESHEGPPPFVREA